MNVDTTIRTLDAWEALDSRGRPTVGCSVELANGARGRAIVPAGASTGGHEAVELRDGGERYAGQGVQLAVDSVRDVLKPLVLGMDASDQSGVDLRLEGADSDPLFGAVGSNAVLGVSLAVLQAGAHGSGRQLWQPADDADDALIPMPMVNMISGGAHAGGAIDIQDVLVIPIGASSFHQAMLWVARVRAACRELLVDHGNSGDLVADEGGLAADFGSNEAALDLVTRAIERAGLRIGEDVGLAIDLAANQFREGSGYRLRVEDRALSSDQLIDMVEGWCARYPILSLEDVLAEDEWTPWVEATRRLGCSRQLLGDDLFATHLGRLQRGIDSGVGNAVLVKPNQAGTVSRAKTVVDLAHQVGYNTVISARSGDTEDHWLADLAVGWRTRQIKVGSTHRSERTAKWNRLLEIESRAGSRAVFEGARALDVVSASPPQVQ